jgi:hypothetical protein
VREKALGRYDPERIAFYVAVAWLLATGVNYAGAPDVAPRAPATTGHVAVSPRSVSLGEPGPLDLCGADPFGDPDEPPEVVEVGETGDDTIGGQAPEEETKEQTIDGTGLSTLRT